MLEWNKARPIKLSILSYFPSSFLPHLPFSCPSHIHAHPLGQSQSALLLHHAASHFYAFASFPVVLKASLPEVYILHGN